MQHYTALWCYTVHTRISLFISSPGVLLSTEPLTSTSLSLAVSRLMLVGILGPHLTQRCWLRTDGGLFLLTKMGRDFCHALLP